MKKTHLLLILSICSIQAFSQNVGIGTASPSYKLQIEGDTYVNGGWLRVSGDRGIYFQDFGGGWYMSDATWIRTYGNKSIYHNSGVMRTDGTFQVGGSGSTLNVPNGGAFAYRTNVLFANISGNVGIGTASPSQKLEITGGSYPSILFSNNISGRDLYVGGGSQSSLGTTDAVIGVTNGNIHIDSRTSNQIYFQHYAQNNSIFNVNGGSVGIGTSSPGYKLDVSGTARFTGQVIVPTTPTANAHAASKEYVDAQVGAVTETDPTWSGSANTTASVGRTGNVGIGTLSPSQKLDVSGNIRASGDIFWGNSETRTTDRSDAGASGSGVRSGFYQTSSPTNFPTGASSWWHLLDVRHSNTGNNYAMQIAGSFFDQELWYRKTDNSATRSWSKIMSSNDINGTNNYVGKFTGTNSIGNSQIFDNGTNVGIGTASPAEKLDVNGNIALEGKHAFRGNDSWLRLNQDGDFSSGVYTPNNFRTDGRIYMRNTSPTVYFQDSDNPSYMLHANSDRLYVLHGATDGTSWNNNRPLTVYQGNKVGINNASPSYELHVSGRIRSNGINETSDIRFKKEILPLENALDKVMQLQGVSYYWKKEEFPDMLFKDTKDLGVIAQEVEKIFPEVVDTDDEGYKSVQYSHLVPVLIEAIKELKAENNALQQKTDKYEALLNQLDVEKLLQDYSSETVTAKK